MNKDLYRTLNSRTQWVQGQGYSSVVKESARTVWMGRVGTRACVREVSPTALLLPRSLFSIEYPNLLLQHFLSAPRPGGWSTEGPIRPSREESLITDMFGSLVHRDNGKQKSFSWVLLFLHRQCTSLLPVPRERSLPPPALVCYSLYINLSVFLCPSSINWAA